MVSGCSLNFLMEKMPHRAFDVGIAEGHAVTFSAGMAAEGMIPFCNIYSSFMRLELCDFTTAMKLIENSSFSFQGNKFNRRLESDNLNSEIRIISIQNILNSASIQYLQNRGVNNKIACKYCKEIHYSVNKHSYFAIGFANDAGGWVLRNKYFKGNIAPSSIRTINNNATHCIVFEGFIDFLSYLSLYPEKELNTNYVVLNSTSQIKRAISFLGTQERVISMELDNSERFLY